jgi:hypothetical protein
MRNREHTDGMKKYIDKIFPNKSEQEKAKLKNEKSKSNKDGNK